MMESKIGAVVAALIVYFVVLAIAFAGVNIDLYLNPWIRGLQLQWWNFFTTEHYSTWLFAIGNLSWLILASIPAVIITICVVIWLYPDY